MTFVVLKVAGFGGFFRRLKEVLSSNDVDLSRSAATKELLLRECQISRLNVLHAEPDGREKRLKA